LGAALRGGPFACAVAWRGYGWAMSGNAAIYLDPEAYRTDGPFLMGRHSAGESFLKGFLRYGAVDRFRLWNIARAPRPDLERLIADLAEPAHPLSWIDGIARGELEDPGVVQLTGPFVGREAWQRLPFGHRRYALCGLTHTTSSAEIQADLGQLLLGPVEPFDGLVCTSTAVRDAVEAQLAGFREYFAWLFGPRQVPEVQRATIPLGLNTEDFCRSEAHRKAWRDRLGIEDDETVALYVGRFSLLGKMNPGVMALALERAAQETGRKLAWVLSGWAEDEAGAEARFHAPARALCPSVRYVVVDGRPADTRFSIWSVADFFISLSDNVQETFGLTPVEAMAAGLPSVVSDWNGYRDTVRDNVDGFRVPTLTPGPGAGADLAHRYADGRIDYSYYVGAASQFTAVDIRRAAEAVSVFVRHPRIAREMGEAAQARARSEFDWAAIIPRYQALWAELDARRRSSDSRPRPEAARFNPWRMDPFRVFAGYATSHLQPGTLVAASPGMTSAQAIERLANPLAAFYTASFPTPDEIDEIFALLDLGPLAVADLLARFPAARRFHLERALIWMAKFDVLILNDAPPPA
jgi:glycosyltransferase involved in cell wall biosynthesis